jgi:hypothetical protein
MDSHLRIRSLGQMEVLPPEAMSVEAGAGHLAQDPRNACSSWSEPTPPRLAPFGRASRPAAMGYNPPIPLGPTQGTGPAHLLSVVWKPRLASYCKAQQPACMPGGCMGQQPLSSSLQLKGSQCLSWLREEIQRHHRQGEAKRV